jgi:hypothetical protein
MLLHGKIAVSGESSVSDASQFNQSYGQEDIHKSEIMKWTDGRANQFVKLVEVFVMRSAALQRIWADRSMLQVVSEVMK